MITHYIISDLHLANGTRRNDFKKNRTKFKSFLRMVEKQKAKLIIAGDFLELLQTNPVDIARTYSDILNELISIGTKIVIGNHDYYLHHFRKLNSGSWTSSKPTYVEVNHNGHCTLKYWPTQSPVKKSFLKYA